MNQQMDPPPLPSGPKKDETGKYILLFGGGCLLLLLLASAIGFFFFYIFRITSGPVQAVNEHLQSIRAGDLEKAYSSCSSGFRQNMDIEQFRAFVAGYPSLKNAKEFSASSREISGDVAKLAGSIQGMDGAKQPAEYQLVKEANGWKIHQIRITYSGVVVQPENPEPPTPVDPSAATQSIENSPQIAEIDVQQQPGPDRSTIMIKFKVVGFLNDKSEGTAKIHLVQDLTTLDPTGKVVPDLSMEGIKELKEGGQYQEYNFANFSNTLTIPNQYPRGKYSAKIKIHDRIGNKTAEATTEFDLQ